MANTVEIFVEAIDNTGGIFSSILSSLGFSNQKIEQINANLPKIVAGFTMASAAVGAAVEYTKEAVKETVAYGQEIEKITLLTGQSAEEASRLYQVAEGVGLSFKELSSALENATKKGIDTSIESLLSLANQYNALSSPIERAKLLTDNFGASGLAMGTLFEQGSGQIVAAMESVNAALVLDEESMQSLKDFEAANAELKNSFDALKVTVGLEVIPTLLKLLDVLNNKEGARGEGFNRMLGETAQKADTATWSIMGLINAIKNFFAVSGGGSPTGSNALGLFGFTAPQPFGQAYGGVVAGNTPYIVGERGPELFMPQTSGKIIPNHELSGGGGGDFDYTRLGDEIVQALMRSGYVR